VYGVRQIRDGNLDYRIAYAGNDEFTAVCSDFNEMAARLSDMVKARQKDEENRKELIAGISHDLCTPLTSILTYVEGIELGLATTPVIQKEYLATIKSKAKDLEHIINQLFLFSTLDVGEFPMQPEPQDIGKLLSDFVKNVASEYRQKGGQITLAENIQGIMVNTDSVQLRNVLTNVIENSLKYGNKEKGIVTIACKSENTNAVITLNDNGPGVSGDALDKLFDVFYRGDKARANTKKGNGLGLAISAKIIERQGGTIKAANLSAGGLSIIITLPGIGVSEK
jgi:signal transduction histidine kinase